MLRTVLFRLYPNHFGLCCGAVEVRGGFEGLEFAFGGGHCGAVEQGSDLCFGHGFEGACGFEGLVEDLGVVDSGDEDEMGWVRP